MLIWNAARSIHPSFFFLKKKKGEREREKEWRGERTTECTQRTTHNHSKTKKKGTNEKT